MDRYVSVGFLYRSTNIVSPTRRVGVQKDVLG